jgi:signal recognition particle subunit SRP54
MKDARQAGQSVDEQQFKRIEAMIQSMTPEERENPSIFNGSRRRRVAMGSGTNIAEVNRLMKQFDDMRKMMKSMSGGNGKNMMRAMQGMRR